MAQYIDKDALVAEIEKRLDELYDLLPNASDVVNDNYTKDDANITGKYTALESFSKFIDTLEVKEVDLDNEYIEEVYSHLDSIKDTADRMTNGNFMHNRAAIKFSANIIAKVLELIGLKAQKGE